MIAFGKTHREIKSPEITARYLADYMAASEQAARPIIQKCKYQAIVRVVQHTEAQTIISNFLQDMNPDKVKHLSDKAAHIRGRLADGDFEKDVNDHNADYIDRFAEIVDGLQLPKAERQVPPKFPFVLIEGTKFKFRPNLFLQRTTKTNKLRAGVVMLRYAKSKKLDPEIGSWQSAAAFGYLRQHFAEQEIDPELKLCLTIDAYSGKVYEAPTDSIYRFNEMTAACATIAERWPAIKPPKGAIL